VRCFAPKPSGGLEVVHAPRGLWPKGGRSTAGVALRAVSLQWNLRARGHHHRLYGRRVVYRTLLARSAVPVDRSHGPEPIPLITGRHFSSRAIAAGNSLAVRLPADCLRQAGLRKADPDRDQSFGPGTAAESRTLRPWIARLFGRCLFFRRAPFSPPGATCPSLPLWLKNGRANERCETSPLDDLPRHSVVGGSC